MSSARTTWVALIALIALAVLGSCAGASPDRGFDLRVRVRGAQLVRAALPAAQGGPSLPFVDLRDPRVFAGDNDNPIVGRASGGTFALNVSAEGDAGYWIVPVGLPDDVNVGELQFRVLIDYARTLPPGRMRILLQATDSAGRPGEVRPAAIEIESPQPSGEVVVTLEWDAEVDADLIVVTPNAISISAKNINSVEPTPIGAPPGPSDAWAAGGLLDQDSNANCSIDGRRRESIYWRNKPPPGRYRVFAGLASTCGLARTSFKVSIREGNRVRTFSDVLYASDARSQPQEPPIAPGLFVTEFEVSK